MLRACSLSWVLAVCVTAAIPAALAGERTLTDREHEILSRTRSVYVAVTASTWMPRGRNLFDIAPSLRTALTEAGFTVVRDPKEPHELTLQVEYREEQGREYRFDMYGTDITCLLRLEHGQLGTIFDLMIRESSSYPETGTPPYLDALHRFLTNPYYFLLGDVIKGWVVSRQDTPGALIEGLKRLAATPLSKGEPPTDTHTMPSNETLYLAEVRETAIRELARLKEPRAVPVLVTLLNHPDQRVRVLSVEALGAMATAESRPAIEHAARQDLDPQVREAAAAALARLPSASPGP